MEIIIVMSLALNIVLWLMIRSMKRRINHDAKNATTLLRALVKLNGITKNVYQGKNLSGDDKNFLMLLDFELALEKERQESKMQA
jgi:hypothetical protein